MFRFYIVLLLSFLFNLSSTNAQESSLQIDIETSNPSNLINDGVATINIKNGAAPFTYKWSNQSTPLSSNKAEGLVEGKAYSVKVTDKNGLTIDTIIKVTPTVITEKFNGVFAPIVDNVAKVLFWDPFAAMGLYDNRLFADEELIPVSNWKPGIVEKYVLKKCFLPNNSQVKAGDTIALVHATKSDVDDYIIAPNDGTLSWLNKEGDVVYDFANKNDVIKRGAHNLATIKYTERQYLTHPNGDTKTKNFPFIVIWLVVGALFFTLRMGFINIRGFGHAINLAAGKYDDPNAPGQVTHFQALATAVSGTVGLGNIAGVAVAISLGGAGASFWIIVAGLLGMSTKFVECTLGVKYRSIAKDGRVFGGPMIYLSEGLKKRNMGGLGKVLAVIFAILCVGASFGGGNMFQANQSFEALSGQFPALKGAGFWVGLVIAILVGFVIIGGIKSIAKVTEKIVPFMAGIYIIACLIVIGNSIENIDMAFKAIINGAFSPEAMKGGILGVLIIGFQRAAFSNEAGVGSAAIAHSVVKTNYPPSEGFVSLLEPFIDTVVVCTLTALVIIFTGMHEAEGMAGATLTSDAFSTVISWFPYVLSIAILLFAFSTMISWSYYGMRAWTYLFGKSKRSEMIYKFIFLLFVILGASVSLGAVLDFSDMMILAMAIPNVIGLYILSNEVAKDLKAYRRKLKNKEIFAVETKRKKKILDL